MSTVRSADGTTIGYTQAGQGPPLILVDGALCRRSFGPPGTSWSRDRPLLCRALGLADDAKPGDPVRSTGEIRPADGMVYFANAHAIGVRTPEALYRFMRGFGKPVIAAHHLFGADAEPDQARQAWEAWLSRTLA